MIRIKIHSFFFAPCHLNKIQRFIGQLGQLSGGYQHSAMASFVTSCTLASFFCALIILFVTTRTNDKPETVEACCSYACFLWLLVGGPGWLAAASDSVRQRVIKHRHYKLYQLDDIIISQQDTSDKSGQHSETTPIKRATLRDNGDTAARFLQP